MSSLKHKCRQLMLVFLSFNSSFTCMIESRFQALLSQFAVHWSLAQSLCYKQLLEAKLWFVPSYSLLELSDELVFSKYTFICWAALILYYLANGFEIAGNLLHGWNLLYHQAENCANSSLKDLPGVYLLKIILWYS